MREQQVGVFEAELNVAASGGACSSGAAQPSLWLALALALSRVRLGGRRRRDLVDG